MKDISSRDIMLRVERGHDPHDDVTFSNSTSSSSVIALLAGRRCCAR
jgi:hypothetical protein